MSRFFSKVRIVNSILFSSSRALRFVRFILFVDGVWIYVPSIGWGFVLILILMLFSFSLLGSSWMRLSVRGCKREALFDWWFSDWWCSLLESLDFLFLLLVFGLKDIQAFLYCCSFLLATGFEGIDLHLKCRGSLGLTSCFLSGLLAIQS